MGDRWTALGYYLLGRLLLAPVAVWMIATIVFGLMRLTPGDPVDAILGNRAPEVVKDELRQQLGLAGSWWEQYWQYMQQLGQLDLGESLSSRGVTVKSIIANLFPATLELTLYGLAIALVIGMGLGMIAATHPQSKWDLLSRLYGIVSYAVPLFWLGMLLQLIFAVQLGWFPIGARLPLQVTPPPPITGLYTLDALLAGDLGLCLTSLHHLALPCLTLGIGISGVFERITRINLNQTLNSDYVEAARARGIGEWQILTNHGLRNALIPIITVFGLTLAALLGGAVLTEVTFSFPGLANRLFEAIVARDYGVVQGLIVFFGAIVVLVSIGLDLLIGLIDPRVRY
ncbi:MAG: ABC transporter permease [Pseudanabaenaceae cyanobacterium bins.68]|nr:ABC transporter permease [Pseudanabaenaceae cyanobacterium bins.68]